MHVSFSTISHSLGCPYAFLPLTFVLLTAIQWCFVPLWAIFSTMPCFLCDLVLLKPLWSFSLAATSIPCFLDKVQWSLAFPTSFVEMALDHSLLWYLLSFFCSCFHGSILHQVLVKWHVWVVLQLSIRHVVYWAPVLSYFSPYKYTHHYTFSLYFVNNISLITP